MKFRIKTIEHLIADAKAKPLKKTLTTLDLVFLGVGCTIGTGIFVLTGIAAAQYAGPAIAISYLISGIACIFAGLAYSELAATIPVAGGSYTFNYAILGEFAAWMASCGLFLGYAIAAATVAAGWSGYFVGIVNSAGYHIPEMLTKIPSEGGIINLPAVLIALLIGVILMRGTRESIILNRVLVIIKLVAIFLFIFIAVPHIKVENWTDDFMPFGLNGIFTGAAAIFFAYNGFDAVATAAEETKTPNRSLPIGIIGSLLVCIVLYTAVALALTGITNYSELNNAEPMAFALRQNGSNIGSALIGTGALTGMMAVLLVLMYGQSRVFFVMSRDGLLPKFFSKMHKKYETPFLSCLVVTVLVCAFGGLAPIKTIASLTSIGILFALILCVIAVMVLRFTRPKLERPFRCPALFVIAPLAILICSYLIYALMGEVFVPFLIWLFCGVAGYFLYGYRKSPLNERNKK